MNNFLSIKECTAEQLIGLISLSTQLKKKYKANDRDLCLAGRTIALLFEKPEDIGGIGKREPLKDIARVLSRYVDVVVARTFEHQTICDLAAFATVPVINALSDWCHPCQAMADILTIAEHSPKLAGTRIAYIGDGNNVARSLAFVCAKLGLELRIASPKGYELDKESFDAANQIAHSSVTQTNDPKRAVLDADFIYTDTWVSMGQEEQKQNRLAAFQGFQINAQLLSLAPQAKIMHCLPAYRGCEITDEVCESDSSIIFDQAENRLHFQRALIKKMLG